MTKEELMKINEKLSIELVTSKDERREEILNEKLEIYRKIKEKDYEEI
ncbi:MAG: hypothetical protein K0S61_714 [Anaerocolumna sp.]|jgi:hypothetical protein|nr:hypothetical protein [Anaerocolumna sp.]